VSDRELIFAALDSTDPEERRRAVARLAFEDADASVDLILRALGDPDWRVRKEAVRVAVAAAPAPRLLTALVEALGPGDNVGLRNAAVEAIAGFGVDAVEALAGAVTSLDADGKKLAAEALARTGQPAALLELRPLLRESDPNVRVAALEAVAGVGAAGAKEAVSLLTSCLSDPDPFLRLAALDGLNELGAVLPLDRILTLAQEPILERAALVAAGQCGDERAADFVVGALDRVRGGTLKQALSAVVQLARHTQAALSGIRRAAQKLSPEARARIVGLAGQLDDIQLAGTALVAAGALCFEEVAGVAARALANERLLAPADEALDLLGPTAVPALVEYARHAESEARAACFELLARLADSERAGVARGEILAALGDESPEVVRSALGALAALGEASCFTPVAQCLDPERPQLVRKAAENAICSLALQFPAAARHLARSAPVSGVQAHAAALVIATLGSPVRDSVEADVEFLSAALSNGLAPLRRAAVEALAQVGSTLGVDAVAFALTDEEPEVRLGAVRALGRLRAPDGAVVGLSHLMALVERPSDPEMFAAGLEALGEAGDPRALPILRPIVRSGEPVAAVAAIEALASFPGGRRVEALIDGLSHSDTEVVKAAMRALAEASDARVLVHLGACLDHEGWDVRRLAADLLSKAGDPAIGLLRSRLRIEDNPLVKDAIGRALEQMAGVRQTPPPARGSWRPR
jgi:HEAT repeat protein